MTALTHPPRRLLTVEDYAELSEDDRVRWELQEGNLVMAPSATPRHMIVISELYAQVRRQLAAEWVAVPDVDLDLQLASADQPGTVRRPDLVVVSRSEYDRVDASGGLLRASEALLVAEVLSPGTVRTDRVIKRAEYADAGIPHYWLIDIADPASLVECHLAGGFGYQDRAEVTGAFVTTEPFSLRIDLTALV